MASDIDMYAPPQSTGWSDWQEVTSHIGSATFDIDCSPAGNTQIYGEVKYWDQSGSEVTDSFIESTTITTGNCVANVEVRLQGNPFGSQVHVTVSS